MNGPSNNPDRYDPEPKLYRTELFWEEGSIEDMLERATEMAGYRDSSHDIFDIIITRLEDNLYALSIYYG